MNNRREDIYRIVWSTYGRSAIVGWTGSELLKEFFGIHNLVKVAIFLKSVIVYRGPSGDLTIIYILANAMLLAQLLQLDETITTLVTDIFHNIGAVEDLVCSFDLPPAVYIPHSAQSAIYRSV